MTQFDEPYLSEGECYFVAGNVDSYSDERMEPIDILHGVLRMILVMSISEVRRFT